MNAVIHIDKMQYFQSVIRICFHERRLQFSEREQMSLWQSERPGERIVEVCFDNLFQFLFFITLVKIWLLTGRCSIIVWFYSR